MIDILPGIMSLFLIVSLMAVFVTVDKVRGNKWW